ncbi:hypothetical protein [Streptomyces sp. 4N124]|uniref:hypothetical protein n=1 Tax=Streptomyces sp. 4N124 TaxID=3457420 RepID=UPI003FD1144E
MTSAKDAEQGRAGVTDSVNALLWRWADHVNGNPYRAVSRPEWFARTGELTLEKDITWWGMGSDVLAHDTFPPGLSKAPVYTGFYWVREDGKPAAARACMVVVPLADPDRIAAAEWDDGYSDYVPAALEGYAVLCSSPFDPKRSGDEAAKAHLREAKRIIEAGDRESRRANYAEIITDPDRGGNALFFPVCGEDRTAYEAAEPDGTTVCLAFVDYDM